MEKKKNYGLFIFLAVLMGVGIYLCWWNNDTDKDMQEEIRNEMNY